jgi:hypothetical protein
VTLVRRAAAGVVVALAGVAAVPAATVAAAAPSAHEAQAWYRHVLNDLHPLQSTLPAVLDAATSWAGGSESAGAARQEFARDVPVLWRVERRLQSLPALEGHTSARNDFASGIDLYAEAVAVDEAATDVPPGALQEQLQYSYERIRQLGDIVFDQGTAELAPLLGPGLAGADVAAAGHVPDWSAAGLAPGAPLASAWRASGSPATGTQPKPSWAAEVGMDGAPAQARVRAALVGHPRPAALAAMASALNAAEVDLGSIAVPALDPQAANRQRLGLLVDVDALLDAEAGRLSNGAPARALARAGSDLGSVGGALRAEN